METLGSFRLIVEGIRVLPTHVQHDLHNHDGDKGDGGHYDVAVAEEGVKVQAPCPGLLKQVVERSVRRYM